MIFQLSDAKYINIDLNDIAYVTERFMHNGPISKIYFKKTNDDNTVYGDVDIIGKQLVNSNIPLLYIHETKSYINLNSIIAIEETSKHFVRIWLDCHDPDWIHIKVPDAKNFIKMISKYVK